MYERALRRVNDALGPAASGTEVLVGVRASLETIRAEKVAVAAESEELRAALEEALRDCLSSADVTLAPLLAPVREAVRSLRDPAVPSAKERNGAVDASRGRIEGFLAKLRGANALVWKIETSIQILHALDNFVAASSALNQSVSNIHTLLDRVLDRVSVPKELQDAPSGATIPRKHLFEETDLKELGTVLTALPPRISIVSTALHYLDPNACTALLARRALDLQRAAVVRAVCVLTLDVCASGDNSPFSHSLTHSHELSHALTQCFDSQRAPPTLLAASDTSVGENRNDDGDEAERQATPTPADAGHINEVAGFYKDCYTRCYQIVLLLCCPHLLPPAARNRLESIVLRHLTKEVNATLDFPLSFFKCFASYETSNETSSRGELLLSQTVGEVDTLLARHEQTLDTLAILFAQYSPLHPVVSSSIKDGPRHYRETTGRETVCAALRCGIFTDVLQSVCLSFLSDCGDLDKRLLRLRDLQRLCANPEAMPLLSKEGADLSCSALEDLVRKLDWRLSDQTKEGLRATLSFSLPLSSCFDSPYPPLSLKNRSEERVPGQSVTRLVLKVPGLEQAIAECKADRRKAILRDPQHYTSPAAHICGTHIRGTTDSDGVVYEYHVGDCRTFAELLISVSLDGHSLKPPILSDRIGEELAHFLLQTLSLADLMRLDEEAIHRAISLPQLCQLLLLLQATVSVTLGTVAKHFGVTLSALLDLPFQHGHFSTLLANLLTWVRRQLLFRGVRKGKTHMEKYREELAAFESPVLDGDFKKVLVNSRERQKGLGESLMLMASVPSLRRANLQPTSVVTQVVASTIESVTALFDHTPLLNSLDKQEVQNQHDPEKLHDLEKLENMELAQDEIRHCLIPNVLALIIADYLTRLQDIDRLFPAVSLKMSLDVSELLRLCKILYPLEARAGTVSEHPSCLCLKWWTEGWDSARATFARQEAILADFRSGLCELVPQQFPFSLFSPRQFQDIVGAGAAHTTPTSSSPSRGGDDLATGRRLVDVAAGGESQGDSQRDSQRDELRDSQIEAQGETQGETKGSDGQKARPPTPPLKSRTWLSARLVMMSPQR